MLTALIVFLPFGMGIADYIIGKHSEKARNTVAVVSCFLELVLCVLLVALTVSGSSASVRTLDIPHVFTAGLSFRTDGFRSVYSLVTALMWAFTTLFSQEYFRHEPENLNRYYLFILMTLGATQGVMLSGDLMTTFAFFEILSLTSFTWVMHEETEGAIRAGYTYLFIAIIGGLVLFMGLALLQHEAGTLAYAQLPEALRSAGASGSGSRLLAAGICILTGFGCKAGMFPVHVWLPKAHPVAPAPASALLSGVLTKVGIYGILMTTVEVYLENAVFGWIVLVLGTITMFLGALLALFSVNLKRTLACSSMSQIGFILTGIGMTVLLTAQSVGEAGTEAVTGGFASLGHHAAMAMSGTMLHMVNHSMLKLCLFCAAGVVVMNIEALDLNEIRGFGRNKVLLKIAFFLGLVGISGVPLFNGYASKTLLHEAITSGIHEAGEGAAITLAGAHYLHVIEWVFLISGGCTFAYMLKLFICVFVEKNKNTGRQERYDRAGSYMNVGSTIVVFGTSLLFIALGQKPVFGAIAAFMTGHEHVLEEFRPLSWECISGGLISLGIGLALYLLFIRRVLMTRNGEYIDRWPQWLDLEELVYRPLLTRWLPGIFGPVLAVFGENKILTRVCRGLMMVLSNTVPTIGEDKPLKKAAFLVFYGFAATLKILSMGVDGLIVLSRNTILRERVVSGKAQSRMTILHKKREELHEGYGSLTSNFSFAMMLACIGMLMILGVIVFYIIVG